MTFSLIVPVYNVEKYLPKCLDSILNQTYKDFEIIVVNDGSPDNSQAIIDEYTQKYPKKIKAFKKENGGLSDARNFGIQRAGGDYLLFIDSDDHISNELLYELKTAIDETSADVVRFSAQVVFENGEKGELLSAPKMSGLTGEQALDRLIDHKQYFEPACFYAYKKTFWQDNNFCFAKCRYHEDFGLIPEIIMKTTCFATIDHIGYFYVQSASSICRGTTYEKEVVKSNDILFFSLNHINNAQLLVDDQKIRQKFCSYIANAPIQHLNILKGKDKTQYLQKLRKEKVFDLLLQDTFKRKLKKVYLKIKYGVFR